MNRYSLSTPQCLYARDLPECDWRIMDFIPNNGKSISEMKIGEVWWGRLNLRKEGYPNFFSNPMQLTCEYKEQ